MASWPDPSTPATRSVALGRPAAAALIGLGGAVGSLIRFSIEAALPAPPETWPWATFCINISGAFLLALILEVLAIAGTDDGWRRRIRLGVGTGMLGGYTTYSTFMVEASRLGQTGNYLTAFGYIGFSLVLGVAAALSAMTLVSALHRRGQETAR